MMATTGETYTILDPHEGSIVVYDVDWVNYEKMLQIIGDRRIHVTYDEGTMEVSMPSQEHEQAAQLLGFFVFQLADALDVDYESLGMTTWKKPNMEKGLESDQCYYIRNAAIVREKVELDLEVDPPPDLAIEVDITSSSLKRMGIYAELRVPELWRYDGRSMMMYQLQADHRYRQCETSLSFPALRPDDVARFIELGRTTAKRQWARAIRDWVRDELIPRRNIPEPRDGGAPAPT
jgi:Uma2 family endonuclease